MRKLAILFLIAFSVGASAQASEVSGKDVQGYWLITTPGNFLNMVLRVAGHKENGSKGHSTYYGYLGNNGALHPSPLDVTFNSSEGLSLSAAVGSMKIHAQSEKDVFVGSITSRNGTFPARLERMGEEQLKARMFSIPASIPKSARVEMLYLTSADCSWCAGWERANKTGLLTLLKEKGFGFVEVKNSSFTSPINARDYPTEYQWAYEQIGSTRGVPRFILAVDRQVVLGAFGNGYYNVFMPALKLVMERREASSVSTARN